MVTKGSYIGPGSLLVRRILPQGYPQQLGKRQVLWVEMAGLAPASEGYPQDHTIYHVFYNTQ